MGGHAKGLPVEILEKIFSHLSAKDLWSCLGVSTQWRYVANSDRFWKKHCHYVGIRESAVSNLSDEIPLCSWGTAYFLRYTRPVTNWRRGRWHEIEIELKSSDYLTSWHGQLGYIYYFMLGFVCIYKVTDDGDVRLLEQVNVEILNQDMAHMYPCFVTNVDFMAVCNCNTVIIYERIDGRYKATHCLTITVMDDINSTTDIENLDLYIISNFSKEDILRVRHFLGRTVWLYNPVSRNFHVFDLITNEVKLRLDYRNLVIRPKIPLLVSLHARRVEVYNSKCDVILTINETCISSVCFNRDTLVANKLSFRAGTTARTLQSWDMYTGKELMHLPEVKAIDVNLHEFYNYMLVLQTDSSLYRISCYCARTARVFWELKFPSEHSWFPELKVVMCEFVLIWPSYNDNDKYSLYEIENGKLVSEKRKDLGEKAYLTDTLWVLENPNCLLVKSFL
ncbi:uncharacterized protein [Halyomorpha halys]|uniref:uncharacterized protein n=1 Tax=Halyomorpha halys TaxID=286706 RepID=UPI0006D525C3|nr:uncharacterized protein LOC106678185 [Halyomorpha halys]